jgi:hypothetical protein
MTMHEIIFRQQGGDYKWRTKVCRAQVLPSAVEHELSVSFRPLAGTAEIHTKDIIEMNELPDGTPPMLPQIKK